MNDHGDNKKMYVARRFRRDWKQLTIAEVEAEVNNQLPVLTES